MKVNMVIRLFYFVRETFRGEAKHMKTQITMEEMFSAHHNWQSIATGKDVPEWAKGKRRDGKSFRCDSELCNCHVRRQGRVAYAIKLNRDGTDVAGFYHNFLCRAGYQAWLTRSLEVKVADANGELAVRR